MILITDGRDYLTMNVKKLTLVDQIYQNIKSDISNNVLSPGQRINVKDLSRKYGVSDTPIKQALNRLMSDKMVVNTPNKGMSVRVITLEEMNDIFDMRLMMDLYFMKDIIATLCYNETLRNQLIENVHLHEQCVSGEYSEQPCSKYYELDNAFHELYLTGSGNKKAVETFANLNPFMYSSYTYFQQPLIRDKECVVEHKAILDAILKQDLNALKNAVETHICNSRKTMQLIFKVNQML